MLDEDKKEFAANLMIAKAAIGDDHANESLSTYKSFVFPGLGDALKKQTEAIQKNLEEMKDFKVSDFFTVIEDENLLL